MKTYQGVQENGVSVAVNACAASCRKLAAQIELVKNGFLVELREASKLPDRIFRLALNEATALAWQTDYPHLLFPALAAEKIQAAAGWNARQKLLRQTNFTRPMSN